MLFNLWSPVAVGQATSVFHLAATHSLPSCPLTISMSDITPVPAPPFLYGNSKEYTTNKGLASIWFLSHKHRKLTNQN